ncbi:hypothetical protein [uncultured Sphingomonas sp.]|uniref:hypothetical protein n=1 Tax=uncultured Sphingomonas sp. TaxID=158754 RepID=UPI0025CCC8C4|nr:hypothetical protein [uncultured Sphingomonas sp.]
MPPSVDYTRRRIVIAALGALLLIGAGHRSPLIATVSITLDDHAVPQVAADWSPPIALALAGAGQAAALLSALLQR